MTSSWPSYENFSPENPAKSLYLMLLSVYITCLMTHCHDPLTSAPHFHLPVGSSLLSHTFPCVPFCWANITASTIKTITSETNTSRIRNAFARLMKYPGVSLRLYTGWYSMSLVSMLQGWTSDLTESTKNPSPAKLELRVFSYQWPRDKWSRVNKWSERCRLTVIYFLLMRLSIVLIRFFFQYPLPKVVVQSCSEKWRKNVWGLGRERATAAAAAVTQFCDWSIWRPASFGKLWWVLSVCGKLEQAVRKKGRERVAIFSPHFSQEAVHGLSSPEKCSPGFSQNP